MSLGTNAFPSGTFNTTGALAAFFKVRYPQTKVDKLFVYDMPFLNAVKRSDELTGIKTVIPVQIGGPQGQSAALTTALQNASSSVGVAWGIVPVAYYGGLTIDARTLMAARNNEGAFMKQRENDYESQLKAMGATLEQACWSDGSGTLGLLQADPGTGTTFEVEEGAGINFHPNMKVLFYADSSGALGSVRAGGSRTVVSVNLDTDVVTVSAAIDAAVGSGDHVVREGNANAMIKGIPAWITESDPTSSAFFDVDRSAAPQMLAGWRQTWLGTIEETAKKLDSKMRRVNQNPKVLWLSYSNFLKLEAELGTRAIRDADGGPQVAGASGLSFSSPGGKISVKCGPYVPDGHGFMLDMSTWELMSLGPVPHVVQDDGQTAVRLGSAFSSSTSLAEDGIEIRLRYFAQLVCRNPYANGRFPISY